MSARNCLSLGNAKASSCEPPGLMSSAGKRVAPRKQGVFFFGFFLLDKQKKEPRLSGRIPTKARFLSNFFAMQ
jgi:hypothetical protein